MSKVADAELSERVAAVLSDPALDAGSDLLPLASFITFKQLHRLHNVVAGLEQHARAGWCRHAALAKLVQNVTGARRPKDFTHIKDFEMAGNAMAENKNSAISVYSYQDCGGAK